MIDSIDWRAGWGFVAVGSAALAGLWYVRGPLAVAWAAPGHMVVAVVMSLAALVVVMSAFLDAGGGGPREWHALSDWYALVNDTPWWGKAVVVVSAVGWAMA